MAVIKAHADWFERGRVAVVTGIATAICALGSTLTTSPFHEMPMTCTCSIPSAVIRARMSASQDLLRIGRRIGRHVRRGIAAVIVVMTR
jgi:hypothetical protein